MAYMATRAAVGVWAWLVLVGVVPNAHIRNSAAENMGGGMSSHAVSSYASSSSFPFPASYPSTSSSLSPYSSSTSASSSCPARCACFGTTVDCAKRGLTRLPRGVPPDTQRL
ncbi:hypothetical protein Pmani_015708 [Petrolisthes manimaculis]|uniref:LRRNT domain-containing protein n=1 Tax=Petrolisthes manimaculis TaxID=1843537 RepID=A0AAE1PRM8_9EUCA|nr:hypothetical protein Pmani_015708 [Petrolisthes manimaculis]